MELLDLHTHHRRKAAVINSYPLTFKPQEGLVFSTGIHPWHAADQDEPLSWKRMQEIIYDPSIIAIGEIGLDKIRGADMNTQLTVFRKQQKLAESLGKPLIIHCVRAFNEIIALKKELNPKVPWIIHGFRGNVHIAKQLLMHDFYLSYGEKYALESLKYTPLAKMFLETDESENDISFLYEKIASDKNLLVKDLRDRIQSNFREIFTSLPPIY